MKKFTTGLVAGGIMTALGVSYMMNDKKSRKKMIRNGKKMAVRAEHLFNDMF